MGPKKAKDVVEDENYWKLCIEETPLNDERWTVKVILMEAAGSEHDRIYLNNFENYAAEERRFVIKNICKTETIFMINQLGGEKKVKDDKLRVFEEGQFYLKEKKDVPPEVMALIIKHLILKMKDEYLFIERQRLEVHEGMTRESSTLISKAEVKGTVNIKISDPQDVVPLNNKKKVEQETIPNPIEIDENKKYSTILRVRGEEWRDKIYIDDYPSDGPNLYVAVTGFLQPSLAGWLIKVGIPLTAVVQIRIDLTSTTIPSTLFRTTKRGQSQTEVLAEKSLKFWENLQQLRINKLSSDDFKNTAFVVFKPPYWNTAKLSGCIERIYDELCWLMYDIQDLTRQHLHYLGNMDIIPIPNANKLDYYQIFYQKEIEEIPLESINVYFVLDAILKTVCKNNICNTSSSSLHEFFNITNQSNNEENRLHKSEILVKELIEQFCKLDSQKKKYKIINGDEHKDHNKNIVINYGDFCKNKTFHLDNINLDDIVTSMLSGMPVNKLWLNRNKPTEENNIRNNFHINMILSCFDRDDVESSELKRLIHILACRQLYNNRSSLKKTHLLPSTIAEFKKTFLKRSILAEPLTKHSFNNLNTPTSLSFHSLLTDKEKSYKLTNNKYKGTCRIENIFDCPDISELVSTTEIANQKPTNHIIDDFEFFQDFSGSNAFQVILDAFNKYNCIDYKYCEVTDCFITMFYNSHNKERISREEWRCHLPTAVCLQDFFDFVLEEHYDWIKNEEKIYDENLLFRSQSEYKNAKNSLTANSCVENSEVELELLMEGSLKYEEMNNVELIDLEKSTSKVFSSKKTHTPLSTTDLDSLKSTKKTKSPAVSTPKTVCPESGAETNFESSKKPFFGYDLGDRRVEVFGKDSTYFAKDGTRVSSFYSLIIPMNLEFVNLNIVSGNFNNEFWIHKALGEVDNSDIVNICESFRINTKDQLTMYLKKQIYKIASSFHHPMTDNNIYKANQVKSPSSNINEVILEHYETKSFHSLFVTWPNGLITESVHENNSPKISHIKQYYLTSLPNHDEYMRCISLNGEVVIFKNNSEIEILKPDSSYIRILKCGTKIFNEEIPESMHSVSNSDKSTKGKDKLTKISSKLSKKILIEDDKIVNRKATEHELFIEEFETIESNGLRQKWIQNNKFNIDKLLIKTATDFCLGEIFSKRMDGTTVLLNKDGEQVVTFPDNTRIVTGYIIEDEEIYPEWTEEEKEYFSITTFDLNVDVLTPQNAKSQYNLEHANNNNTNTFKSEKSKEVNNKAARSDGYISVHIVFTVEHSFYTTVIINKYNGKICIKSPNNSCVTFDTANNYEFSLDKQTSAQFDGENLNIKYYVCSECNSYTSCEVKIKSKEINSTSQLQKHWLKMTDSFRKEISVDEEGNINIIEEDINSEVLQRIQSDYLKEQIKSTDLNKKGNITKTTSEFHDKCKKMWKAESLKFFILRRDLTCSELVHRAIVEQYKEICRMHPWCSINHYDTFGNNRNIYSILTPIYLNESEKWLMASKLSHKPKYLTFKDLVNDSGKGFYRWMRPYKRFKPKPIKPNCALSENLPRAFILRILEQQWKDSQRENLKGAKELIKAILCYRKRMETDSQTILNVPIKDQRLENEKKIDDIVQTIASRIYKDLKFRLADYAHERAKSTITTKSCPESISLEKSDEEIQERLQMYQEKKREVNQMESAEATNSNLKRYWRRRDEEYKEEEFYKYLLREGSVPPYFRNVLGGAIWWDMSKTANDAVTSAERRRMKCCCNEE